MNFEPVASLLDSLNSIALSTCLRTAKLWKVFTQSLLFFYGKVQEGISRYDHGTLQEMELAPVQRKIEARSAEDSFTGFVRTLYFADTFLRDSKCEASSPSAQKDWSSVGSLGHSYCLLFILYAAVESKM